MRKSKFDNQIEGQMSLDDLYQPEERLVAVSKIFARARKDMSLAEQKAFVYALAQLKFTRDAPNNSTVYVDKKTLASIVGVNPEDTKNLSINLKRSIEELPRHSYIVIDREDIDLYSSGFVVTAVTMLKNRVRIRFNEEYIGLFTNLTNNYITMWSMDIFKMTSKRSVQFYEYLRQETDTRQDVNSVGLGIKALKEMFDIPKDGKGSYMREKDGFNRFEFENKVIDPLCEDLARCKMINLVMQKNGKFYEKVKQGNRVLGYRFYWTFSAHPAVAPAKEVRQIQERVDKNPQVLKIAKDVLKGEKTTKKKKNSFNCPQHDYNFDELEQILLKQQEAD